MRNFILLLSILLCCGYSLKAQTRCATIESILVDACGSPEGINEMFRFKVGANPLNTANLSVKWSSNPWLGVCQDATTSGVVIFWNRTITQCGLLVEPINGVLPAGKEVLFVTSEHVDTTLYSFAALQDTLIVLFQCGATTTGHFKNYQAGAGSRTTILKFSGANGCSDTATYIVDSLINQQGIHSATLGDGATANFHNNGPVTYSNQGCTPIIPVMSVQILTNDTSICPSNNILLNATAANYKTLKWVGGAGSFSYTDSLQTTYSPGVNDVFPLSLILRAYGGCHGDSLADTVKISTLVNSVNLSSSPSKTITCTNPQITITASGGAGLTYNWGGGNTTATKTVTVAGIYTVTATGSGCTTIVSDTIRQNIAVPNVSVAPPASLSCHVASVTLTASSTTPNANYNWGSGITTPAFAVTTAGSYTVTVTDPANGCTATAGTTVTTGGGTIVLTETHINPGCTSTGSGSVSVTTGTAPYSYIWSNADTTAAILALAAGTYSVTVTDAGGCSAIATFTLTTTNSLTIAATAIATHCGNNNGSVNAVPLTGTGPFIYHWNTGAATAAIANLSAGAYLVTVTTGGGCSATATTVVDTSSAIHVAISADKTVLCAGDTAHLCTAGSYTSYVWNNGSTTPCIAVASAGNYYVTVTDTANCSAISVHLPVSVLPSPPVSISVNGDTLIVHGATTIQWLFNGGVIPGANSPVYIAHSNGDYTVAVTDTNGCTTNSNPVAISTLGINDVTNDELRFYPNPSADGNWVLQVGTNLLQGQVEIFDNNGRLVYKSEIREMLSEISLTVMRGIYFVHIGNGENNIYRKLIKM